VIKIPEYMQLVLWASFGLNIILFDLVVGLIGNHKMRQSDTPDSNQG
jgi:hypothetical protein